MNEEVIHLNIQRLNQIFPYFSPNSPNGSNLKAEQYVHLLPFLKWARVICELHKELKSKAFQSEVIVGSKWEKKKEVLNDMEIIGTFPPQIKT